MLESRRFLVPAVAALFIGGLTGSWLKASAGSARADMDHRPGESTMAPVSVRYIVNDVEAAVAFYTRHLGFGVESQPAPAFAVLSRGGLRLLLSAPAGPGGAAQPMPDGRKPEPGGWNRIRLEVPDLAREVATLRRAGARFRNDIVTGFGGQQILLDDPSGNPVELFEPRRD